MDNIEEDDIEKDDIEEDDFEENTNFCSGETHSISNVKNRIKRENVNNFVKQIDEIPCFTNFINFHIHFDGFGLLT